MSALFEFKQRAWKEVRAKEDEARAIEQARAKAASRHEARLKAQAALARTHVKMRPFPKIGGGLRFVVGAVCWIVWAYVLGISFALIGSLVSRDFRSFVSGGGAADRFAVAGFCISLGVTWFTPEIFYSLFERLRLWQLKKQALAEYHHYRMLAEMD